MKDEPRSNYKSIQEIEKLHNKVVASNGSSLFDTVKFKLIEFGFEADMLELPLFLEKNPEFLGTCNKIQDAIYDHKIVLLLVDDLDLIWNIQKFFPILYAINNQGKSVFRVSIKYLIDAFLNKDKNDAEFEKRLYQNLVLFSNMFSGDNRLSSFAPSIEGIIVPLMFSKKVVFTAHTTKIEQTEALKDAFYKLKTFYSPSFAQAFVQHAAPIFIQTFKSKASLWKGITI